MVCSSSRSRSMEISFLCHSLLGYLSKYVPLIKGASCAAASSSYASGIIGHRRRAAGKHLAVGGNMNILFIRRRAKFVHVSCLVSSVFSRSTENDLCRLRYLHHGTLAATEHLWNSTYSNMQDEAHPPSPWKKGLEHWTRKDDPSICMRTRCVIASVLHRFGQQDAHEADDCLDDFARSVWSVQWIDNNILCTIRNSDVNEKTMTTAPMWLIPLQ